MRAAVRKAIKYDLPDIIENWSMCIFVIGCCKLYASSQAWFYYFLCRETLWKPQWRKAAGTVGEHYCWQLSDKDGS